MQIFRIDVGLVDYPVSVWRHALTESLRILNATELPGDVVVELAGGTSPLAALIEERDGCQHIVVDISLDELRVSRAKKNICADVNKLPLSDASVSLAISISSMQYYDHDTFFAEVHRVLASDGVLAVHENGPWNPIILAARGIQWFVAWRYRKTIKRYLNAEYVPDGFEILYRHTDGLLTPLIFALQKLGAPVPNQALQLLESMDLVLLRRWPALRHLAFFNVIHFRKI